MQPGLGVSLDFPCKKSLMGGLGSPLVHNLASCDSDLP